MVNIDLQWVSETQNITDDYGIDRGSQLIYHVRYDLPGLDFMSGHVHTIPVQAIADHMMTMNLANPEDALEYCILDRVAMNYLEADLVVEPGARVQNLESHPLQELKRLDASKHAVWDGTAEALSTVCQNMEVSDPETMVSKLFTMVDPCACKSAGKPFILPSMPSSAASTVQPMMENIRDKQGTCRGRCGSLISPHTLNKKAKGWGEFCEVLSERSTILAEERSNVFDIRYGESLKKLSASRCQGTQ